jgi:large subunit ribosomal protein L55
MPADMSTLSEAERIARLEKRKPKKKIVVEEELEDSYDINRYSHLWKKK